MSRRTSTLRPPDWAEKVKVCEFNGVKKFYDIMPMLADSWAFCDAVDDLWNLVAQVSKVHNLDLIVSTEGRGLLFGPTIARNFHAGFVPVMGLDKLPDKVDTVSCAKACGHDTLQIQRGLVEWSADIVIIDDLIATGNTALATIELVRKQHWNPLAVVTLIELTEQGGRKRLEDAGYELFSVWKI